MNKAVTIDIGSTWTKGALVALDGAASAVIRQSVTPTTQDDLTLGFRAILAGLLDVPAEAPFDRMPKEIPVYFSSSAKGGLAIAAIGLVPDLTLQLAKLAAMSAGGKVVRSYSYSLTADDIAELETTHPDMILLSGGTDGGNSAYLVENARMLAGSRLEAPVIFAGNRAAAGRVASIMDGKDLIVTENLMPEIGRMNLEPAREKIRDLFLDRIVAGRGLSEIVRVFGTSPKPTPLAVFELVTALPKVRPEWDDLAVIDLGGATTDFYSNTESFLETDTVVLKGVREPKVKRTVEGDLGMRVSTRTLYDSGREYILDALAREGLEEPAMTAFVEKVSADTGYVTTERFPVIARNPAPAGRRGNLNDLARDHEIASSPSKSPSPRNDSQQARNDAATEVVLDRILAEACVFYAALRHAGGWREAYTPQGKVYVQSGKDLRRVKAVVGSGGYLSRSTASGVMRDPLLRLASRGDEQKLVPDRPAFYADSGYLFPLAGNLAEAHPAAAAALALSSLTELSAEG